MARAIETYGGPLTVLVAMFLPALASAHEVYVLDAETVARGMAEISPNPFTAYFGNESDFFFWGFVSLVVVSTLLCASLFRVFEKTLDPLLFYLKRWAHPLVRITVGSCLISFGIAGELYGTEIDFETLFGSLSIIMQGLCMLGGVLTIAGIYVRTVAALAVLVYAYGATILGWYVLTYTDHLGAYLLLLVLGAGPWSLENLLHRRHLPPSVWRYLQPYVPFAYPAMRMLFGFGIMFAAIYAKFIHSQLALDVVIRYHLTDYFPFDPLFIVLGALIIEFLAGLMMFLIFWLTLSLLYFQEAVWPHIILFGIGFAIFCHGYDRFSLEGAFLKRRGHEPIF
jgi:hypothetical protein